MQNRGLLFIPDISGFTRFVTETEIDHSRLIIQELLEVVIDANQIGLQVSEVEGDAVLFFRFGASPELKELWEQVERTFRDFHERLSAYEVHRFCQCRACVSASGLTLKIITHYGEFVGYNVRSFEKLIGRDVIVAHQLLKNDLEQSEYWLVTSGLLPADPPAGLPPWLEWRPGVKRTEHGDVPFRYAPLSELRRRIPPPRLEVPDGTRQTRLLTASREYDAHIITLLHATGDPRHRPRWQDGVESVEEESHWLPRVGMRSRRVGRDGRTTVYATAYSFRPDLIEFSETEESGETAKHCTLESLDARRTRLTVDVWVDEERLADPRGERELRRGMEASLARSLANLDGFVRELRVPTEY